MEDTRFCQNCGAVLEPIQQSIQPPKDRGRTVLLAALPGTLVMGLGQLYTHRIKRGLMFMILGLTVEILFFISFFGAFFSLSPILTLVFGVIWLGLWVFQIRDADSLAK
jgi:hypothetical protein